MTCCSLGTILRTGTFVLDCQARMRIGWPRLNRYPQCRGGEKVTNASIPCCHESQVENTETTDKENRV